MSIIHSIKSYVYNLTVTMKCCKYEQVAIGSCKAKGGSVVKPINYADYYFLWNSYYSHLRCGTSSRMQLYSDKDI